MKKITRWLKAWWTTRPFHLLWQAIPALLILLGLLVAGIYYTAWNPLTVHDRYDAARQRAFAAGDLLTARIAGERLIRVSLTDGYLLPRYPEHLFNMALCLKGLGMERDAAQLMDRVAPAGPESSLNYPMAQLYMAKEVWNRSKEKNEGTLALVERHLLRAAVDEPGMEEAHQLLGELYLQKRDWDKARRHILKAVDKRGECLLLMAILSQQVQDKDATRQWSARGRTFFQQRLDSSRAEDVVARVGLAKSHLLLGEFKEAVGVYQTGLQRSGDPQYKSAIANVYAAWITSDRMNAAGKADSTDLNKIRDGLNFDPTNQFLLTELIRLSQETDAQGQEAQGTVRRMLADGGDTSLLHFCLGVEALRLAKPDQAGEHFDLAFQAAPNLPQIANNMAMILSMKEGADLERALSIIDPVVKRFPQLPPALDTRGHILMKLKRWKEAVSDLELALAGMPGNPNLHASLALCYENLGMSDLAAEHRQRAAKNSPKVPATPPSGSGAP